ncbi:uncharacterized protein LOC117157612 isoform X1 [Bombus vancouverensis nearcticus]|uniref:uncharacterized protein LOC117157612 isoform X1 n=1 Tax=Bombus vancouverensis nearcticus TaxID=2705178 RepID=UPI00402BC519
MTESVRIEENLYSLSDYSLQLNRWFLKPIGVWPLSASTSRLERTICFVLIFLCYFFVLFTIIPCLLHLILEDENIRMKLKILGPFSHWLIGGINYSTLLLRSREMRVCIEHIQNDWKIVTRQKDQQVMMRYARIGRYTTVFCTAFMQVGVLSHCTMAAFATKIIEIGNETRIIRLLPCGFYKSLISIDVSPTYEIILASQFVSGFIANSSAVGAVGMAAVFAAHAYGQLTVLMIWIKEYVNRSKDHSRNVGLNEIGEIVEHHLRVLSFIAGIEDVMNEICFMELFKCTMNMCMIGYYILTEWKEHDIQYMPAYLIILFSMTFNIFVVCYIGETLKEQCEKVGEVVYMTNWYYLPYKDILNLIQIILRSSMMIKITAGNKNCLRIFQPVAPSHIIQYIFDLLMRKLVKFKI